VVDRHGLYRGIVNVEQIAAYMRDTAREAPAANGGPGMGAGHEDEAEAAS
jgi:hypothetical protein